MKIKYDLTDNYFRNYNEANGAICLAKKMQKNPKTKVRSYLTLATIYSVTLFVISIILICVSVYINNDLLIEISSFLLSSSILLFVFYLLWLCACSRLEINSKEGTLVISKTGIVDENKNGNKLSIAYKNIKAIIITKNLIVFSLNTPLMLFIPNKDKKNIVAEITKYSNVPIIDKSK